MSPLVMFFRRRNSRNAFIQDDMNKFAVGPHFLLVPKYAFALNTIFVTLFYCSGMPILLFFAAVSLIMQFLVEKYLLIHYYARPPNYEHQVNTFSLRALPFALILHLAIGIYAYGSENIFLKVNSLLIRLIIINYERILYLKLEIMMFQFLALPWNFSMTS